MVGIFADGCARAASGHAIAAPPSSDMNARRLMVAPSSGLGPHITTPLRKGAAVHHSKNCAMMSQMGQADVAADIVEPPVTAKGRHSRFQLSGERLAMMLTTLNVITTSPA
jgi:hypothetical protein